MGWSEWIRAGVEVEPSLYAADFRRLGEQIDGLLASGCRVFHFDFGDGHFVPPVTMGPVVLRSIAPSIHDAGGVLDCHLMVDDPVHHLEEFAASGADSVTFHVEAAPDPGEVARQARAHGLEVGVAFNPETDAATAAAAAREAGADLVLCMSIHPGYSGQSFMPEALDRIARPRDARQRARSRSTAASATRTSRALRRRRRVAVRRGKRGLRRPRACRRVPASRGRRGGVSLERALELAEAARGRAYPNPTVGAVVVGRDGATVGEGVTEPAGGPHAEVVALEQPARRRAAGRST